MNVIPITKLSNVVRLDRDPAFVGRVMARWAQRQDTAQIATELMTAECFVANALAFGRDQRRGQT
jgi:hypothetical protein